MKKILYFEKYIKINQEFCELSIIFKELSSIKKTATNCQNSSERLSKLKSNSFSTFVISSLSSINSRIKQRDFFVFFDFVCFNILQRRFKRVKTRKSSFSINEISNFTFFCLRFKLSHETSTQK